MAEYAIYRSYTISHSGTKGMHWGIRRYQNPDGTLTPEGKERYYKLYDKKEKYLNERDSENSKYEDGTFFKDSHKRKAVRADAAASKYERKLNKYVEKTVKRAVNKDEDFKNAIEEFKLANAKLDRSYKKLLDERNVAALAQQLRFSGDNEALKMFKTDNETGKISLVGDAGKILDKFGSKEMKELKNNSYKNYKKAVDNFMTKLLGDSVNDVRNDWLLYTAQSMAYRSKDKNAILQWLYNSATNIPETEIENIITGRS